MRNSHGVSARRRLHVSAAVVCVAIGAMVAGCGSQSTVSVGQEEPTGEWIGQSECLARSETPVVNGISDTLDCVRYQYDGTAVLAMTHANAGFNCVPVISAEIDVRPAPHQQPDAIGTIEIREREIEGLADCNCLIDLDYLIEDLPPGLYWLLVDEEEAYLREGDEQLEALIDLSGVSSDTICVERHHYPWGSFR